MACILPCIIITNMYVFRQIFVQVCKTHAHVRSTQHFIQGGQHYKVVIKQPVLKKLIPGKVSEIFIVCETYFFSGETTLSSLCMAGLEERGRDARTLSGLSNRRSAEYDLYIIDIVYILTRSSQIH